MSATKEWRVDGFEINDGSRSIVRAPHPDEFRGLTSEQRRKVAEASQENLKRIVTAVNERERLREALRDVGVRLHGVQLHAASGAENVYDIASDLRGIRDQILAALSDQNGMREG